MLFLDVPFTLRNVGRGPGRGNPKDVRNDVDRKQNVSGVCSCWIVCRIRNDVIKGFLFLQKTLFIRERRAIISFRDRDNWNLDCSANFSVDSTTQIFRYFFFLFVWPQNRAATVSILCFVYTPLTYVRCFRRLEQVTVEQLFDVFPQQIEKDAWIQVGLRESGHVDDLVGELQLEIRVVRLQETIFDA